MAEAIASMAAEDAVPHVRRVGVNDLFEALGQGWRDFQAAPTQLVFLALIYPVVGLLAARAAWGGEMLPLFFPLVSGFALLGPVLALGIYELSRRREKGWAVSAVDALAVFRSPAMPSILGLGLVLLGIFAAWILTARMILFATLGRGFFDHPMPFLAAVFGTPEGWTLILVGNLVGAAFAVLVLALTVVSFPLLLDRPQTSVATAVRTSLRAFATSPLTMLAWGVTIGALLAAGSLLVFAGLAVVVPVLGHATWHLYRKLVA